LSDRPVGDLWVCKAVLMMESQHMEKYTSGLCWVLHQS